MLAKELPPPVSFDIRIGFVVGRREAVITPDCRDIDGGSCGQSPLWLWSHDEVGAEQKSSDLLREKGNGGRTHWRRVSPATARQRSSSRLLWRAARRQPDGKSAAVCSPPIVRRTARAWHVPSSRAVTVQTIGSKASKLLSSNRIQLLAWRATPADRAPLKVRGPRPSFYASLGCISVDRTTRVALPFVSTSPPRSFPRLYNTVAMARLGDCIDIDSGLNPTARANAAFFIPTSTTDKDLLLFSSAAVFSPPAADPLLPWLADSATRRLGNAVVVGPELRHLLHDSKNPIDDPQRTIPTRTPGVSPVPAASSEMPAGLSASRSTSGPSTAASSGAAGIFPVPNVGASAAPGVGTRVAVQRDPNQVICRGLRSVDELMLA